MYGAEFNLSILKKGEWIHFIIIYWVNRLTKFWTRCIMGKVNILYCIVGWVNIQWCPLHLQYNIQNILLLFYVCIMYNNLRNEEIKNLSVCLYGHDTTTFINTRFLFIWFNIWNRISFCFSCLHTKYPEIQYVLNNSPCIINKLIERYFQISKDHLISQREN